VNEVQVEFKSEIFKKYKHLIQDTTFVKRKGYIVRVIGLIYEAVGPLAAVGEKCIIQERSGDVKGLAEVVGFRDNHVLLMPVEEIKGIGPGCEVITTGEPYVVNVSRNLIGRIIDGLGRPIDGKAAIVPEKKQPISVAPIKALKRARVTDFVSTGIRSIDGLITLGKGQKVGIFSGSGIGKSILLGMIARNTRADINVIGLIGERGREVRDFIEKDLGPEGLKRSVVVAVTNDESALLRIKGAMTATAVAEYFRDQGMDVMLMMDSITRIAMAQREIGLSAGEPPTMRGYPPSMYAMLPRLLERAGNAQHGSITGVYTVLVEGDDLSEPVSDTVRAILDGHIVLSRRLADANHYPAVDVLTSVSRLMIDVISSDHRNAANKLINLLSAYRDAEDLINIGAYAKGSNPRIDTAMSMIDKINSYLRQDIFEKAEWKDSIQKLIDMMENVTIN